jgi:predicted Zn-dependent protease
VNPVTGKKELSLISENQEIALGQKTDAEIQAQYGVYNDPAMNSYLKRVGMVLAPQTHRPKLNYQFTILDSPVVNAFAVPGGYVYVTRGIMAMMNSEAELAAVLSHELGHINARHSIRRLNKLLLVQFGFAVGKAMSDTFAKLSGLAGIGAQLLFLKYSRDDERQADELGVQYSRNGGFNPTKMISFFSTLQKLGDHSGGRSLPGFLSTHPLTSERIQNVKGMIIPSDSQLTVKHDSYLRNIENIVYDDDPRQGYAEKNVFYHPQMRFSFSFSSDWKLQNTPTRVILTSKDGNAGIILQAEKSSENLRDYAKKKTSKIEGSQVRKEQSLTINQLSAFQQLYDITQLNKEDLRMRISFIRKGPFIFTFSALSTSRNFGKYDGVFTKTIGSFKKLTDKYHIDRKPLRIKLIRTSGRESLQKIFQKAGMKKDLWPEFAIMNAMELSRVPKRNQLIKIVK